MTDPKTDYHRQPAMVTRPDPALRKAATDILSDRDWTTNEFVEACLHLLTRNPDAMLQRLMEFRPHRKRGRPPKTASDR